MTGVSEELDARRGDFDRVVLPLSRGLQRAFVAHFGVEIGSDVAAEVSAWAWEHIDQVTSASNPGGLLYRVGQSRVRYHHRWARRGAVFPAEPGWVAGEAPELDDELLLALGALKPKQRVAVLMVHGYGFSYLEVADLLGDSVAATTNHVHRGLYRLRRTIGGTNVH